VGIMPGQGGDYYARMQNAIATHEKLEIDLSIALRREAELTRQLEGEEPTFGLVMPPSGPAVSSVDVRISQYEAQLDELRLRFTDKHPDIVALEAVIERLMRDRATQLGQLPLSTDHATASQLSTNPVYQQLKLALSESELEVATLRERVAESDTQVNELRERVDSILDVERQLAALNRDYQVTRDQFETLLRKRETLRMTDQVEEAGNDVNFQILEAPRVPTSPVSPNRVILLIAVTVAALGSGVALAFVCDEVCPVYTSPRDLRGDIGYPVIGSVSFARSEAQTHRLRLHYAAFVTCVAGLLAASAVVAVLQEPGARALQLLVGISV
jgi:polysaccharide chain length determinant protein (PEP-CTERM system associated)